MNLQKINKIIKQKIPKAKIIFSLDFLPPQKGSLNKKPNFLEKDIFLVFNNYFVFKKTINDKENLFDFKKEVIKELGDPNVHIYFITKEMLALRLYHIDGFYFNKKGQRKNYYIKGNKEIVQFNFLKICLRCLVLEKIGREDFSSDRHFLCLQKNFFKMTNRYLEDFENLENEVETIAKEIKKFENPRDRFFYFVKFKKIFPLNFERDIVDCLLNLKRFINTNDRSYANSFYEHFARLEKIKGNKSYNPEIMFELINKYIFLVFVI